MADLIGALFLICLLAGAYLGLRALAKPRKISEAEFERRAAEGPGIAGSGMQALHELLNPEAGKSKEVQMEIKAGRYNKKQEDGEKND